MDSTRSVTQLLIEWSRGNPAALDELTPRVYEELHTLARAWLRRRPNSTLQPTELIDEVYVRLIGQPVEWESRAHFLGIAAHLMRNILVDHFRARCAAKRGGAASFVTLEQTSDLGVEHPPSVLELDEALSSLEQRDKRKAKVIELRYFGGLTREEVATSMGLTVATVKRDLRLGEAWLRRHLMAG